MTFMDLPFGMEAFTQGERPTHSRKHSETALLLADVLLMAALLLAFSDLAHGSWRLGGYQGLTLDGHVLIG
jgi:hypothetical protein